MLCLVFYLNLRLKYVDKYLFLLFFYSFCKYLQVSIDIKKLCGYLHNEYSTDMGTDTE